MNKRKFKYLNELKGLYDIAVHDAVARDYGGSLSKMINLQDSYGKGEFIDTFFDEFREQVIEVINMTELGFYLEGEENLLDCIYSVPNSSLGTILSEGRLEHLQRLYEEEIDNLSR